MTEFQYTIVESTTNIPSVDIKKDYGTSMAFRCDEAARFLECLFAYKGDEQLLLIWTLDRETGQKKSSWFKSINQGAEHISGLSPDLEIYLGMGLSDRDHGPHQRLHLDPSKDRLPMGIPGFWVDIDVQDPGHKAASLPPTQEAAIDLVRQIPIEASLIVATGGGIHVYWLFKEIWEFDSDEERYAAAAKLRSFQQLLRNHAQEKGWNLDNTADLTRIMRIPGTYNNKLPAPRPVQIIQQSDVRINPGDLDELLPPDPGTTTPAANSQEIARVVAGLKFSPTAQLPAELLEHLLKKPKFNKTWAAEREEFKSPSEYDMSITSMAIRHGATDQEALDLILSWRRKHGHDLHLENAQKYARTISRVRSEYEGQLKDTEISDRVYGLLDDNQMGDASLLLEKYQGQLLHDHAARLWHMWKEHHWQEDRSDEVLRSLDPVVDMYRLERDRQRLLKARYENVDNDAYDTAEKLEKRLSSRVTGLQTLTRRRNVLELAASSEDGLGFGGDDWDTKRNLLACPNGVIELDPLQPLVSFRPGSPNDFIKTAIPTPWPGGYGQYDYQALASLTQWPYFWRFLNDVFNNNDELVRFVIRLLGYALSAQATQHILPIFWGVGANGKSTLMEVLATVLGDLAGPIKSEILLSQKYGQSASGPNAELMTLRGKRLAWASETDQGRSLDESKVKMLVGGDSIIARAPYARREVSWSPTHTLFLLTNHKPRTSQDPALWRRLLLVPFEVSFVSNPEKPHQKLIDRELPNQLRQEAAGILVQLVLGWLDYLAQGGLNPPDIVRAATEQYQNDEDVIARFLDDCCLQGSEFQVKAGNLRQAYDAWAELEGEARIPNKLWGEEMLKRFHRVRRKDGYIWHGIGLRSEMEFQDGVVV